MSSNWIVPKSNSPDTKFVQKMKMQETFKKDSGHMNVQHVTDDFLIFTLLKFKATKKGNSSYALLFSPEFAFILSMYNFRLFSFTIH